MEVGYFKTHHDFLKDWLFVATSTQSESFDSKNFVRKIFRS